MDEHFWVAAAFVVFFALVLRPLSRTITHALDKRSAAIGHELAEAVRLREEAQATLAAYQKKHRQITEESEEILKHAREEARRMQLDAQASLKKAVENRIALADEKITLEEKKAIQDVQRQVVDVALQAARSVIAENMKGEADERMIRLAVKDIHRIMH